MAYRDILLSKTIDYIKLKKLSFINMRSMVMIDCPYCKTEKSAHVMPSLPKITCMKCGQKFNLIDLVQQIEDRELDDEETILNYLKELFNVDVQTNKDEEELQNLINIYRERNWALVPCARPAKIGAVGDSDKKIFFGKEVIQGDWTNKENRDTTEWSHWISSGLNIGVRTGKVSNLTIIDFDLLTKEEKVELVLDSTSADRKAEILKNKVIPEEILKLAGNTLIQESHGGFHFFYQYDKELPKTCFNYSTETRRFHIDIENDGGQVIIQPSTKVGVEQEFVEEGIEKKRLVGYASRKFINNNPIIEIPIDFLNWLLYQVGNKKNKDNNSEKVTERNDLPVNPDQPTTIDLLGNRNNSLIALGGMFRKEMNMKQTAFAISVVNKYLLSQPLPTQEINHILEGLSNYSGEDNDALANDIINYLKETDYASKQEIEAACFGQKTTSENKKRLDRTLMQLIQSEKIIKKGARDYKILQDMSWSTDLLTQGLHVNFKVPYFGDYAVFNWGDIVLVGGVQKAGKSHLAMNFAKRLIDQGIKPRYCYNESGCRYAKIALQLGIKPGEIEIARCNHPSELIMRQKNCVYIYDWYRPTDFTKTADDFEIMADKLDQSKSLMICFTQLREGNVKSGNQNDWFAKDQIRQFVAISAKYLYEDKDGNNTFFELGDIRESKTAQKRYKIPCKYNRETKEVVMVEELERQNGEIDEQQRKA